MKKTLLKITVFTIIIGVVALAFNTILGKNTITYLEKVIVNYSSDFHWHYYKIDFWGYFRNIQLATSDISILQFDTPTRVWSPTDFVNDLGVIGNVVIFILNILMYPIKVGAYFLRNITAILGINQDATDPNNGLAWLITFVRDILGNWAIPYI